MKPVATLADVRAIEAQGIVDSLPSSTYDLIRQGAAINPAAPALTFFLDAKKLREAEVWTYGELLRRITQTANALHCLGVGKDDVVATVLPNLPETHFTVWGGQAAGIVAAFNPLLEPAAIATLLNAARAKVLVTLAPFPGVDLWSRLQPVLAGVESLEHVMLVNLAERVPGPEQAAVRAMQAREVERLCGPQGVQGQLPSHVLGHDFWTLVRPQPDDRLVSGRSISPYDHSSFFCTGGTTGLPKIAMRLHRNEVANACSLGRFVGDAITAGKTVFCGLPLFHVNGVLVTGLMPFAKGAHVVLGTPQGYRGDGVVARFWEIVETYKVNFFSGVPTLYTALMQVPVEGFDIGSLEYGICGAAPMPVEVFRSFQERTGLKILEGYGLTEGTCVSSVNPLLGERRIGSIGLRLPGQDMKAVMLNDGGGYERDCAVDEVGVLVISGPNVFSGYCAESHNAGIWLDCGAGRRWLNTGDLGRQDADGYFWLTGRKKELIIRGGHNIDPAAIEEPLHQHPAVQIAAAVGRPDVYAGELPVAYVQLRPGHAVSEEELNSFARSRISERAAIPKYIRIIDHIPLTAVGKIFKPVLRHQETRDALMASLAEAGLSVADVIVKDDPAHGTIVEVRLADSLHEETVRDVLGRYPFTFRITQPV